MLQVKKRERKLKSGLTALYFDYRLNGERHQENTGLHLLPGKDKAAQAQNKETLIKFQYLQGKKQTDLMDGVVTTAFTARKRANFIDCYKEFMELYPSKERRYKSVLNKLVAFHGSEFIPVSTITDNWLEKFYAYLRKHLTGETPYDYFKALTRVLQYATKAKLFAINPSIGIRLSRENNNPKDVLTMDELKVLQHAACPNEYVKRAFLFSALTGLRYCDVKRLKWADINADNELFIKQAKTGVIVTVPLTDKAVTLVGHRGKDNDQIFLLPTNNGCNKSLKAWVKNAGIDKTITYHCARHSLGTNLHLNGADVLAIASILGHTSMKHTQRYVRSNTGQLRRTVNLLPEL